MAIWLDMVGEGADTEAQGIQLYAVGAKLETDELKNKDDGTMDDPIALAALAGFTPVEGVAFASNKAVLADGAKVTNSKGKLLYETGGKNRTAISIRA